MTAEPDSWRDEFPQETAWTYLNHAGISPWPRRSARAVAAFSDENAEHGPTNYSSWLAIEGQLRRDLADLIGAAAADISLIKSTSEGLSFVASGLDWRPGENVVTFAEEFPSNRYVWEALGQRGVATVLAPLDASGADPEDVLMGCCTRRTRLVSVSAVQYAHGLRLDLEQLSQACRQRGILLCVDAIQAMGAAPLVGIAGLVDFLVADGHKWLMGPEGLGLLYVHPAVRERLAPSEFGWHSVADSGDFDRKEWQISRDGRRFECGSPNMLGAVALGASVRLLHEVGLGRVHRLIIDNITYLIEGIVSLEDKLELLSSLESRRQSGIVTFRPRALSAVRLHSQLRERGVIGAVRGGGIRWSPHFHTRRSALDTALSGLHEALRT